MKATENESIFLIKLLISERVIRIPSDLPSLSSSSIQLSRAFIIAVSETSSLTNYLMSSLKRWVFLGLLLMNWTIFMVQGDRICYFWLKRTFFSMELVSVLTISIELLAIVVLTIMFFQLLRIRMGNLEYIRSSHMLSRSAKFIFLISSSSRIVWQESKLYECYNWTPGQDYRTIM